MGAIRSIAVAAMVFCAAAVSAQDCTTDERLLSTRSSNPNLVAGPSAWSGSVLAVVKYEEASPRTLWVGIYGPGMETIVADRPVAGDASYVVALLWNGDEFGLFYRTAGEGLSLLRIDTSGNTIESPVAITPAKTFYGGDEIDVVWNSASAAWVVGRSISQGGSKGVWLTYLERSGAERSDRRIPVAAGTRSALELAVTDTGVVGAFFNNALGNLAFARATDSGSIDVRTMVAASEFIEATTHDGLFVVVRSAPGPNGTTVVRWFVVDTSQQTVRPDGGLVDPSGDDAWPLGLISTGEELALTYIDAPHRTQTLDRNFRLLRFKIDGTVISDTPFAARSISLVHVQSPYTFAWTGTSFLTSAVHSAPDRLNSYLLRFCPLRIAILSPTPVVRVGQPVTFSATASGGVGEYQFSWVFPAEIGPKRGAVLEREFERTGTYTVTLIVTDATGTTVTQEFTITVIRGKSRAARH